MAEQALRSTPLEEVHQSLGATFTDFAGWNMPVRYGSDLAEHAAVRERAGLFDLSHMGEIHLRGPEAPNALDHALAGRFSAMSVGRAKYSLLLTEDGGIADDVITYRLAEDHFLVVADAAAGTALIAEQGPASAKILLRALTEGEHGVAGVGAEELEALKNYRVLQGNYRDRGLLIARTGYTGEDGFELYLPAERAAELWQQLTEAGGQDLTPCGLACRDTLRLEAGMPLYGHEIDRDLHPAQSGLGRVVALKSKQDFVGRAAFEGADTSQLPVLVGLVADGRRAARAGSEVRTADGEAIGSISSGALSPTLGHPIAMAFVRPDLTAAGTELIADVRGKDLPVRVSTCRSIPDPEP